MFRGNWKLPAIVAGVAVVALASGWVANAEAPERGTWQPATAGMIPARNPRVQGYDADLTYAWFTDGRRVIVCTRRVDAQTINCTDAKPLP